MNLQKRSKKQFEVRERWPCAKDHKRFNDLCDVVNALVYHGVAFII